MDNLILIIGFAIATLVIVIVMASVLRGRLAKTKGDPKRYVTETERGITDKISRGSFTAELILQCSFAISLNNKLIN